jgi:ribonuclease-3
MSTRKAKKSSSEPGIRYTIPEIPPELLQLALTHPSSTGEGDERTHNSNQRLEFLGDAIVGAIVADHLYRANSELPEGELTQRKAALVRGTSLAKMAQKLALGEKLVLGRGEEKAGGRERDTNLADAFEAVVAALFLAQGWEATRDFVTNILSEELRHAAQTDDADPFVSSKNLLQEKTQAIGLGTPRYETEQIGKHGSAKRFAAQVFLLDEVRGKGQGRTKKEAENIAARAALDEILATEAESLETENTPSE